MDARRPRVRPRPAALASLVGVLLALGLAAGPAGATEPGPSYPPGAEATDVVEAGGDRAGGPATPDGPGTAADRDRPAGGSGGTVPDESGPGAPPPDEDDPGPTDHDDSTDDGGDEAAAPGATSAEGAPGGDGGRGLRPILIVTATAVLLGGGVVAIARRI